MELRRTRKGWVERRPERCPNGHELRGGQVLVGTLHCDCMRTHRTHTCRVCGHDVHAAAGLGLPTARVPAQDDCRRPGRAARMQRRAADHRADLRRRVFLGALRQARADHCAFALRMPKTTASINLSDPTLERLPALDTVKPLVH
jgi:hypothetical protein